MINKDLLAAGTRIRLFNQDEQGFYSALIKKAGEEGFMIDQSVFGDTLLHHPAPGTIFRAAVFGRDAVYHFETRVIGICGAGGGFIFDYPHVLRRQQRRQHVRLPCRLSVYCWPVDEARQALSRILAGLDAAHLEGLRLSFGLLEELNERLPARQWVTLDLSGGGVRMIAPAPPQPQENLLLKICTNDSGRQFFLLEGRVIRVTPLLIGNMSKYRVAVVFINISRGSRERIIRYIFSAMRKQYRSMPLNPG